MTDAVAHAHGAAGGDGPAYTGWYAAGRMARGVAWAAVGFALGVALLAVVRNITGHDGWSKEASICAGYLLALPGWLFGMGMWDGWGREWFGHKVKHAPSDWGRYFSFCHDHKVIGIQYLATFVFLFLFAGLFAMVIRWQLLSPNGAILTNAQYNSVMSMHGTVMIAVAVAGVAGSFGNYILPLQIGAPDMAFPRMNNLSYWMFVAGASLGVACRASSSRQ